MILQASEKHFETVKYIVQNTIETIYPKYYPKGAVDFFLQHHSDDAIMKDIARGMVYLIRDESTILGTGSVDGNEIKRLFVLPEYQGNGYGTILMDELERVIFRNSSEIVVDASFPAYEMYLHRGYVPVAYHTIETGNGHYLCYHVMKKWKHRA